MGWPIFAIREISLALVASGFWNWRRIAAPIFTAPKQMNTKNTKWGACLQPAAHSESLTLHEVVAPWENKSATVRKKKFRIIVLTILSGLNITLVFLNLKRGPVLRPLGPDFQYWGLGKEQQSLWSQHSPDQSHCPLRTWPKPQNKLNKLLIFQKVVER